MKHGLLRFIVLAGLGLALSSAAVAQRVLGGYKEAPVDDPEVVAAADFAVSDQGAKQETPIALVSVEKAERQVVAGTNFRLCLKVEVDDETQEVKVLVFRSLQKEYSLKSWEEASCGESGGDRAHATRLISVTPVVFNEAKPIGMAPLTDPVATFSGARVVHNITVKGKKGMRVHASFNVRYGLDVPCRMIAYFFEADGTALESSDRNYTTQQGKVSASAFFTPQYDPAVYNDLQIFIPYEALNMESGDTYNLKFYLALYDNEGQRFFGKSGWYTFRLTMP
jgi:hypothetical protein